MLLQKKNTVEAELASLQQEMAQAKADADDAKASLTAVMSEIKSLRAEKDRMLAKVKSADARLHISRTSMRCVRSRAGCPRKE